MYVLFINALNKIKCEVDTSHNFKTVMNINDVLKICNAMVWKCL